MSETFAEFFSKGWADHATASAAVAERLPQGLTLATTNEEISQLANLAAHVFGEHLGRWSDGIAFLNRLTLSSAFSAGTETDAAINRLRATLEVASGDVGLDEEFSVSDQIRILAVAASAVSAQNQSTRAAKLFAESLARAGSLEKSDPANRALAVAGNNLASALEESTSRSQQDTSLMILAAQTGRKYWEIAGTWSQVQFAEYRLASSFLAAGKAEEALYHAQLCLSIGLDNRAEPKDQFWAYEILARIQKARRRENEANDAAAKARANFEKMPADDQVWCKKALEKLGS